MRRIGEKGRKCYNRLLDASNRPKKDPPMGFYPAPCFPTSDSPVHYIVFFVFFLRLFLADELGRLMQALKGVGELRFFSHGFVEHRRAKKITSLFPSNIIMKRVLSSFCEFVKCHASCVSLRHRPLAAITLHPE